MTISSTASNYFLRGAYHSDKSIFIQLDFIALVHSTWKSDQGHFDWNVSPYFYVLLRWKVLVTSYPEDSNESGNGTWSYQAKNRIELWDALTVVLFDNIINLWTRLCVSVSKLSLVELVSPIPVQHGQT